jgi:hypothetical protein
VPEFPLLLWRVSIRYTSGLGSALTLIPIVDVTVTTAVWVGKLRAVLGKRFGKAVLMVRVVSKRRVAEPLFQGDH